MKTIDDLRKQLSELDEGSALYLVNNGYTAEQGNVLIREGVAKASRCPISNAWLIGRAGISDSPEPSG
jgi:hypothetical protein